MAKYYGAIGYSKTVETVPGVWEEQIVEKMYYGELTRNTRNWQSSNQVNDNLNISNEISILADSFAIDNLQCIKYVSFMGAKWKVTNVNIQYPRLILTVGGVYNGE